MSTYNATITASADDAQEATNVVTLDDTNINVNATTQTGGLRFLNVTIPQGSTINSATLTVYLPSGSFDDPYITIKGEDIDDAPAFVAENNNITNRTTTTASVTWDASSLSTGVKVSPDISTVIQEIVDRAGWASGNDLALIISAIDNTSLFRFRALDATGGDYATLDVDYTTPNPTSPGTTNLISWWSLDETSGTRADSHGSNDLSDGNTVSYATGKVSNAADFVAANNEYLEIADNDEISMGGTDFTIALWCYTDSISSTGNWLINKRDNTNQLEYAISILNAATDYIRFQVFNGGTTTNTTVGNGTDSPVSTGAWQFVVARFNNTTKLTELIINAGTPITATATGYTIANGTNAMRIGMSSWAINVSQGHDGLIDEVAIWKRVLTNNEVDWLYNSGNGRAYADLSAPSSTQPPRTLHQFRQRKP